jgi:tetratricopeptide (TPR) repeat protein
MKTLLLLSVLSLICTLSFAQSFSQKANILYQKGQLAERSGDPISAQKYYDSALKEDPTFADARFNLSEVRAHASEIAAKGSEMKFSAVPVSVFQVSEVTLEDALDRLNSIVVKNSKNTIIPNFIIEDPNLMLSKTKISITLKNVPANVILKYIVAQFHAKFRYDNHAIVIFHE